MNFDSSYLLWEAHLAYLGGYSHPTNVSQVFYSTTILLELSLVGPMAKKTQTTML